MLWVEDERLNSRCMQLLLEQSSSAFVSSGIGGTVLIYVFWEKSEVWVSIIWVFCYLSVAILRVNLRREYYAANSREQGAPGWLLSYGVCVFLSGLCWGLFLTYLTTFAQGYYIVVLLATYTFLLAGAVTAYAVSLPIYVLFSLPIIFPPVCYLLVSLHEPQWLLAAVILCWYLFMVSSARRFSFFAMRSLGIEYENTELVKELEEQNRRAEILADELLVLSNTDSLTGIYNRRYFDERFDLEWTRAKRSEHDLAIIICDIDYFKAFNDSLGHLRGDECIKRVAGTLKQAVRAGSDFTARIGGEEFALVLTETNLEEAKSLAERLRRQIKLAEIHHPASQIANVVTLSFGVASMVPEEGKTYSDLQSQADEALYRAKSSGRDRVMV